MLENATPSLVQNYPVIVPLQLGHVFFSDQKSQFHCTKSPVYQGMRYLVSYTKNFYAKRLRQYTFLHALRKMGPNVVPQKHIEGYEPQIYHVVIL